MCVSQEDKISPLLFNISLEDTVQNVKNSDCGIKLVTKLNVLAFAAGDVVLNW